MSIKHTNDQSVDLKASESIIDLQSSIRLLVNERRVLQARLGNSNRRRRYDNPELFYRNKLPIGQTRIVKRERETQHPTALQKSTNLSIQTIKTNEVEPVTFPVEKRPKVSLDDSTIQRTKNLFGSLLGHLKKAKTRLDVEKTQRPAELQRAVTEQVDHMLKLEKKNIAELKRRDYQERQKRDIARIREVQKELRCKEARILEIFLREHFSFMKNFIQTECLPMIFWVPNQHNGETRRLQEVTKEQIERKLKLLSEKLGEDKWIPSPQNEQINDLTDINSRAEQNSLLIDGRSGTGDDDDSDDEFSNSAAVHPDLINDDDESDDPDLLNVTEHSLIKNELATNGKKVV